VWRFAFFSKGCQVVQHAALADATRCIARRGTLRLDFLLRALPNCYSWKMGFLAVKSPVFANCTCQIRLFRRILLFVNGSVSVRIRFKRILRQKGVLV